MAKPIAATPVLFGEDARRIQDEMCNPRPVDVEKKRAQAAAIRQALRVFKMVAVMPTGSRPPAVEPTHTE